jgi:hypothetical protein
VDLKLRFEAARLGGAGQQPVEEIDGLRHRMDAMTE